MEFFDSPKHTVLLFGITGGTGSLIAKYLLANGHTVLAVARHPQKLSFSHPNLQVSTGDILQPSSFTSLIKASDVVISAVSDNSKKPTVLYSEGIKNLLEAKRLICISACPVAISSTVVFWLRGLMKIVQQVLKYSYADMRIMESLVKTSESNWTIIRPPMLTDKPARGKYKIAVNSHLRVPFSIGRADLAGFIVSIIDKDETYRTIIEIAY